MKECKLDKLKYLIRYPKDFSDGKKYPAIFYLHGAGTRSQTFDILPTTKFFTLIEAHENFPFVVVAPLCTENTWFDLFDRLKQLVLETPKLSYVDEKRIYLVGVSMGAYASWQLAMSMPEYFAAMVPICGGGMYCNAGRLINVPVWAFHGAKDTTVFVDESVKMVDAINKYGGCARLTVYPENDHDAWSDTFANPEVFSWLLQHQNSNESVYQDNYSDAEVYG